MKLFWWLLDNILIFILALGIGMFFLLGTSYSIDVLTWLNIVEPASWAVGTTRYYFVLSAVITYFILRYWIRVRIFLGIFHPRVNTQIIRNASNPSKLNQNTGLTFSDALKELKEGERIARSAWNDLQWLTVSNIGTAEVRADNFWSPHNAAFARENGGTATVMPCITIKNVQDQIQMGWVPSQGDLFANDWVVLD